MATSKHKNISGPAVSDQEIARVIDEHSSPMGISRHDLPSFARGILALVPQTDLPPLQPVSRGDWGKPTSYVDRFTEAVALLCRKSPPADLVAGWLDKDADDQRLQDFAADHAPAWAQGIGVLDAAHVMASQPTEDVAHEIAPDPAAEFNRAIDFAITQGIDAAVFLDAWRHGDTSEWPEFEPSKFSSDREV